MKRSKSWDINIHRLRYRQQRKELSVKWETGKDNTADYFTKHHSTVDNRQ